LRTINALFFPVKTTIDAAGEGGGACVDPAGWSLV
jgi:hypothetical protein